VTPVRPLGLVLGKLGPYLFIGLVQATIILAIMRFLFDVPIRGNLLLLFVLMTIYLFPLLALGFLISTIAQTQLEAQQLAQLLFLPSVLLSGYIFPLEGLPVILRGVGELLPATHMIAIMRGIVLRNADAHDLAPHALALVAFGVAAIWLSVRRFSKTAI
ncbi:MAG: ABC transporter permease, partial [Polyangiaceae bacterium]